MDKRLGSGNDMPNKPAAKKALSSAGALLNAFFEWK
jgi:hypothetical protein